MIREGFRWTQKPPMGTPLDSSHPVAAGIGSFWLLAEGGGTTVTDSGPNRAHGQWVGTPNWVSTVGGGGMTSLVTSVFIKADAIAPAFLTTPPFWLAAYGIVPSGNTTANCFCSQGGTVNSISNLASLLFTNGTTTYTLRDSAGANANVAVAGTTYNDGLPHLYHARSRRANDHRLAVDGIEIGTGTTTIGSLASTQFTIGVSRTNTVNSSAKGAVLFVAGGPGLGPEPMDLKLAMYSIFAVPWLRRSAWLAAGGAVSFPMPIISGGHIGGVRAGIRSGGRC